MNSDRFCSECRHFDDKTDSCQREIREGLSLISGKLVLMGQYKNPFMERFKSARERTGFLWFTRATGECGHEGVFWEAKDDLGLVKKGKNIAPYSIAHIQALEAEIKQLRGILHPTTDKILVSNAEGPANETSTTTCEWEAIHLPDRCPEFRTQCGALYVRTASSPSEQGVHHCYSCSKPIKFVDERTP